MDDMKVLSRIAPDLMADIGRRAQVLSSIETMQPVGRRALAARLNLPEREVRAAAAALKEQGLISMDAAGMQLTPQAIEVIPGARDLSRSMFGLTKLEQALSILLGVPHVVVVSGNADTDHQVLKEVGRAAAHRVHKLLQSGMTLAVTGGSTMSEMAHGMQSATPMNVMVVPARGGMGTAVETQANTVAAEIARRIGGHHRVMHLPDTLDAAALQELMKLPEVKEIIELLERTDLVVHGIGRADVMAQRRRLTAEQHEILKKQRAVGEAFGDYFDFEGKTVLQASTVSLGVGKLHQNSIMVGVAAGEKKAEAIIAASRHEAHNSLITDEAAARRIVALLKGPDAR
ncbi:MAG: sugar-binding transcriptional regulator [Clostridia bacterium]|nr:sugar-binding transcriptional regulator [Clostridia bacterium]